MANLNVAILGSGNIGCDLLIKTLRSNVLDCTAFLGRRPESRGLSFAASHGVVTSDSGIQYIEENPDCCDIVFDATSAAGHALHAPILKRLNKPVIDLTPAKMGTICIPAVNLPDCIGTANVNMVTCGGQAAIPVAYAIGQTHDDVEYVEVVSSIASRSAGPATRMNLDEYIHTTEDGIRKFSRANRVKAILNLNPAVPCVNMQTTIMAKVREPNLLYLEKYLQDMVQRIRKYVPGYDLLIGPILEEERVFVTVRVTGVGDYLPSYAGNLDIITCAAIGYAESLTSCDH